MKTLFSPTKSIILLVIIFLNFVFLIQRIECQNAPGAEVDIMVIYTTQARQAAGGTSNIQTRIENVFDQTNQIFINSKIKTRVRLVYQYEAVFTESIYDASKNPYPDDTDIAHLNSPNDGIMDEAFQKRDEYGADIIGFIKSGWGGTTKGGITFLFGERAFDNKANLTFAHELGHQLGCKHAVGDTWDGDPPGTVRNGNPFMYSHGWNYFVNGQRMSTVMAYTGTSNLIKGFTQDGQKVPYFSNPDVLDRGVPTGVPIGEPEEANNALSIDQYSPFVAAYRPSKARPPAPKNFQASDGAYENYEEFSWDPSPGATHYRVYSATHNTDVPTPISSWITATSLKSVDVPVQEVQFFYVRASQSESGTLPGELSDFDLGWRRIMPPVFGNWPSLNSPAPEIKLVWSEVKGAPYYRLYRSETEGGEKVPLTDWVQQTNYTDTPPEIFQWYYYWIQCAQDDQGSNASSFGSCVERRGLKAPDATASKGQFESLIQINWDQIEGANYYLVYRSDTEDGDKIPISGWINQTQFIDNTVFSGKDYYYWIKAAPTNSFLNTTNTSNFGNKANGWAMYPSPSNVIASQGTDLQKIVVTWDPVPGAPYYQVEYAKAGGVDMRQTDWSQDNRFEVTTTPGELFYFKINVSLDEYGTRKRVSSNLVEGWRGLAAPSNLDATDALYEDKIRTNWDEVPGANYYKVFRSANPDGPFAAISDWITSRYYEDYELDLGAYYYYVISNSVRSSDLKFASQASNIDQGSIRLKPPSNITATKGTEANKVIVTWSLNSGTFFYQVAYSTSIDGEYSPLTNWTQNLSRYEDSNIRAGDIRYYRVRIATDATGDIASAYCRSEAGFRYLPAPTNIAASDNEYFGEIHLTWDPTPEASHYLIFRASTANETSILIGNWQPETIFVDTNIVAGYVYYYSVKAAADDKGTGISSISNINGGYGKLPQPENVYASKGEKSGNIRISWKPAEGALYYKIYRSLLIDGEKEALNDFERIVIFEDETAEYERLYYYWVVTAFSPAGFAMSDFSIPNRGWLSPPVPRGVTASDGEFDDRIRIEWPSLADGMYYQLYRRDGESGDYQPLSNWQSETYFDDFNVSAGMRYYYRIKAGNGENGERASGFGGSDSGWKIIGPPNVVQASQGDSASQITVTWEPVEGAAYYHVFRSEFFDEEAARIGVLINGTSFIDETAEQATIYYYTVQSTEHIVGLEPSRQSEEAQGWLKPLPPTEITASNGTERDRIIIQWNTTQPGLYYRVHRSISLDSEIIPISPWQTESSFTDTDAQPGRIALYWVQTSLFADGSTPSDLSDKVSGWPLIDPPSVPVNLYPPENAVDVPITLNLDWGDCDRTTSYNVLFWKEGQNLHTANVSPLTYTSTKPLSERLPDQDFYGIIDSQLEVPYSLEPDSVYFWQVVAINQSGSQIGPVWSFTTQQEQESTPTPQPEAGIIELPINSLEPYLGYISSIGSPDTDDDEDWYQFHTYATGAHIIETHQASGYDSMHTVIYLYGPDSQEILISFDYTSGSGAFSRISRVLEENRTYYIKVIEEGQNATGYYTIDVKTDLVAPTPTPIPVSIDEWMDY